MNRTKTARILLVSAVLFAGLVDPCPARAEAGDRPLCAGESAAGAPSTGSGFLGVKEAEKAVVFKGCSIIRRAFMTEAAVAYEKISGIRISVMGGGATLGIRSVAAGDADIGGSCRPPLPDRFEQEKGVYMTQVGWDALAFVTHPDSLVEGVTLEQVRGILLGTITNWKEVGGPVKTIIPVLRRQVPEEEGERSGVGFMTRLMIFNDPETSFTDKALFFRDSSEIEEAVERLEHTFAVTGVSSARKRRVKILKLDGVEPTKSNIVSGRYPLYRPLYLMTRGRPKGEAGKFLDWLLSNDGQQVVAAQGTVNPEEGRGLKENFKSWLHTELVTNYR